MSNQTTQTSKTQWLAEYRHPSPSELFCLPSAIYFLLKFRADLAGFNCKALDDRLTLYCWWELTARQTYPDFDWVLRPEDLGYLRKLDNEELITRHSRAIRYWLSATSPSVLDMKGLAETLLKPLTAFEEAGLEVPRLIKTIVDSRDDLSRAFDLHTFTGQLACLSWWQQHGQREYPRIKWSPAPIGGAMLEPEGPIEDDGPHVPRFISSIIKERPDLQAAFDLRSFTGRLGCLSWWLEHGHPQYAAIKWIPPDLAPPLYEMEKGCPPESLPVPRFLRLIVNERPDLKHFCALDSFIGRSNVLSWWAEAGSVQYPVIRWSAPALPATLFDMQPGEKCALPRIPRFLNAIRDGRPDLQTAFDLDSFGARVNYLAWWDRNGKNEYRAVKWSVPNLACEVAGMDDEQPPESLLPRFLELILTERPDLRDAFDQTTVAGREQLVRWWNEYGGREYPLLGSLAVHWEENATAESPVHARRYYARTEEQYQFGVNIVGFPQGVLGLGEDARMAARVFQLNATPVALINAPMLGPAKLDRSVDHLLSDELKYGISLICLPAPEMVRLALEGGRRLIDAPTHKIGAWPWELPHWPSAFGKVHQMVDEIWAQSKFVQSVYSRLGDTPVYHMPMAVELPAPLDPTRARFRLPPNEFLFYLMFDGNSWLSRKNPLAGLQAFKQAFGMHSSGVGLVIKAMNVRDDDPMWRTVLELSAGDSRIHVVTERLSRQDSIDFMACCDAYISLHRSEGFGRVIAEAMALGQPVVVTNFSGNVDFCRTDTAFLVDGDLIPLRPGDYLFSEGQYWCDPDVLIAAEQLRRVIDDAPLRENIAQAGQQRIIRDYSVTAVARAYARRLAEIGTGAEK
ncbi:glycosyltransferase family 4 protein [Paraburkholderia strydomiana]|uniref:Glycosyltransferase family 4 protein n=1 Tax=Paraburkholderia strydomiana TaxID=1245417 RepID=A0ABW9BXB4_9BURK